MDILGYVVELSINYLYMYHHGNARCLSQFVLNYLSLLKIWKKIDNLSDRWTRTGLDEAIKHILSEDNTLFQSLTGKLNNMPELKASLRSILMEGTKLTWNPDQRDIVLMRMFGFIRNENIKKFIIS